MNHTPAYLCVDLGGTVIKAGVVRSGHVLDAATIPAFSEQGLLRQLPRIEQLLRKVAASAGTSVEECAGLGLAFPTLVDATAGRLLAPMQGKYADAMEVDLSTWARQRMGLPVRLENDARAALLGEWKCGAGIGCEDLVMVTLGTGIGTAVVMEGRPLLGRHHQAGVLGGHFLMTPNGSVCGCGGRGCAETEAGAAAIARLARIDAGFISSRLAIAADVTFETVFACAAGGDSLAIRLRDRCMDYWGAVIVNLIHAYDPGRVIIGGGVMKSADLILRSVRSFVEHCAWTPWGTVEIKAAKLGSNAALAGMAIAFESPIAQETK
jgi:glucokinase